MHFIMSSLALFALLCGFVLAQDATKVTDNPLGVSYGATLPDLTTTNIRGSVVAQSDPSGTGALFQVSLSGLPEEGGPFLYHIHDYPIANSNCSTAGGHLDPFLRGDSPSCSGSASTCQVGDLSGKHGKINATTFSANYVDEFVSMTAGTPAFVGNRSIVVHYANKTMITCASFSILLNATNSSPGSNSTYSNSTASTSSVGTAKTSAATKTAVGVTPSETGDATVSTGGAVSLVVNGGVVLVGVFALLF